MKSLNEVIIVKYARVIRDINKTQIEHYERLIQEELGRLFPSLQGKEENGTVDWSCDIMNCDSDEEVIETISRIRQIEQVKAKKDWTCKYCGKNTYEVDCDYLVGVDHLSCVLEDTETEENTTSSNVDQLKHQMQRMQDYITQLEHRLSQLETHYNEPTN